MSKTSKKEVLIILWNEIFLENKRFSKRFSTSCRIFCTRLEIVVLLTSYTNLNIKDVLTGHIVYHKKKIQKYLATITIQKYLATITTRRQAVSLARQ